MSDPKPRRHRKRFVSPPEPPDDMRPWLHNEGTIVCELPDDSRDTCVLRATATSAAGRPSGSRC